MTPLVSRQALEEALELLYEPNPDHLGRNTTPVRWPLDVIGEAARALLDGEALDWCAVHDKACANWDNSDCRFESQLRVRVGP